MSIPIGESSRLRATFEGQTVLSQQINFQRDVLEKMLLLSELTPRVRGTRVPVGEGNGRLGG